MDFPQSEAQKRWEDAEQIKKLRRVLLPRLSSWNYGPCSHHNEPKADCEYRLCGGDFFDHQTKSIAWLYVSQKGLDSSVPGSGKTNTCLGLLCLIKDYGEKLKAVIICQTSAVRQWAAEAARFAPGLDVAHVSTKLAKDARIALYGSSWDVLILGHHIATRDISELSKIGIRQLVSDDVDPLLNQSNATAKAINALANKAERVITCNATSLQMRLEQLYAASLPIGGKDVFGSLSTFQKRYKRKEPVWIRTDNDKLIKQMKVTGYKNLGDLRSRFNPMSIRHNYDDLTDIRLPDIMPPNEVWLDMYPQQRAKYALLQKGVLELAKKDQPPEQKSIGALAAYTHGTQICAGLPALGEEDGPGKSIKLDWLENQLMTTWENTKVVVFAKNIGTVKAFHDRMDRNDVGYATIWGQESSSDLRAQEIKKFWEDPKCRVLIGTSAMERSLNLQISNVLVYLDSIPNPARMTQLLGRVRRAGSVHKHVFIFYLLITDSQEERYLKLLASRQLIADAVNSEEDAGLFGHLTAEEMMKLITD